jgi:glutathione reductase (NADPH)
MTEFDFDLFVIGAGSGGVRAARMAASMGARVAIAEEKYLGGTCVNVGCVPKKLFVYASHFQEEFAAAKGFGWSVGTTTFDWSQLINNKNAEIQRLQGIYAGLLKQSGATLFDGKASLIDAHTVQIADKHYRAQHILIATGGWPSVPEIAGKEHIMTSNDMFALDQLPNSIVIVGGGYIAVEFAGIMNGLGVKTSLCYRGNQLLRGFDDDIRNFLAAEMSKKGVAIHFNAQINSIEKNTEGYVAHFEDGSSMQTDLIMYATGRTPNTQHLGLEALGVAQQKNGAIKVNQYYQTNIPSIYALGDVTDRINLTPVATAEAMTLINWIFKNQQTDMNYENIPTAVFSQPNIATVGLSEADAREKFDDISIYISKFKAMKNTLSGIDEKTLMKMIVRTTTDQVVGIHMVGADAGEIIQGMAVAIKAGATKAVFDSTIGIHPTAAEEFVTMRSPVS